MTRAAKFVLCTVDGFEAQHRWEDLALIGEVIGAARPALAVEFGTAAGGFAVFLARTLAPWGGRVVTVDREPHPEVARMLEAYPAVQFLQADLLTPAPHTALAVLIQSTPSVLLYCDNGNKMHELRLYAPLLPVGAWLGCHDYGTEVDPETILPVLGALGYEMIRREDFEALRHEVDYPVSLTRFWQRVRG